MSDVVDTEKKLLMIRSAVELWAIPGYRRPIDKAEVELVEIIGETSFDELYRCGLTCCRHEHLYGFVVKCGNGLITNIGQDCGKRYFGVVWGQLKARFQRQQNIERWREAIVKRQSGIVELRKQTAYLWLGHEQGLHLYDEMRRMLNKVLKSSADNLRVRARRNEADVRIERTLTAKEREAAAATKGAIVATDLVGRINGLGAVHKYPRMKKILFSILGTQLDEFIALDVDALSIDELKRWSEWAGKVSSLLAEAKEIMKDCERFLVVSNRKFLIEHEKLL